MVSSSAQVSSKRLGSWSPDHQFLAVNVTGDSVEEFIYLDHQVLYAYGQDSSKLFAYNFGELFSGFMDIPQFQQFNSDSATQFSSIQVTDTANNRLNHFTDAGTLTKGFPFEGSTRFVVTDLMGNGRQVLICGDKKGNIKAYRLER